ncbi:MAG: flagellar brake protein [Clostridiales bacterium]|nr:flagellar brake protein [Clostridiales bacterium]
MNFKAMNDSKLPVIGDKLELCMEKAPPYRTQLEDIDREGNYLVPPPQYRRVQMEYEVGQALEAFYFRHNGRYGFRAQVVGTKEQGELCFLVLRRTSEPYRQQRRESFRLPISLKIVVRPAVAGPFPLHPDGEDMRLERMFKTENLSETGLGFKTSRRSYEVGELLYINLYFGSKATSAPIEFYAQVCRRELVDREAQTYFIGVKFLRVGEDVRQMIARFVLREQQELIRRRPPP